MDDFLLQAVIYLGAAVVAVPIAARLGLGSVLGYLIAGVMIGPLLGLVGSETEDLQHFAEFGVVMMLFLVGLELEPKALWAMRSRLLGLGGLQVGLTTGAVMAAAMALGQPWSVGLAIGMVFAMSSTAIVLQTLGEKGLIKSDGGQASFSVLLTQDIAVIPMFAILPLLALPELAAGHHEDGHGGADLMAGLAGWQVALVNIAAVAWVVVGGHYVTRPVFRFVASIRLREAFTATALFMVILIAEVMTVVGLSPALGTFLAGVVLANSEFRHELESDIEPFKGLLLGLFFITVGAGIDFGLLFGSLLPILAMTLGLIAIKAGVLLLLARIFKIRGTDQWLLALGLAQAGEFGFVLLSFTVQNAVIPEALADSLLLIVALSMLLTPLLFIFYERVILPRGTDAQAERDEDVPDTAPAIIAGVGRFGQVVNRILLAAGYRTVVLDHQADYIDRLRIFGIRSFYGDASRPDLLLAAGLHEARVLVVAVDDPDRAVEIVDFARREVPNLHIIARAHDRLEVYKLYAAGANDIVRETFDSSVRAGRYALESFGMHPFEAERTTTFFVEQDLRNLRELAPLYDPDIPPSQNPAYVEKAKEVGARLERELRAKGEDGSAQLQRGWMTPGHRDDEDD